MIGALPMGRVARHTKSCCGAATEQHLTASALPQRAEHAGMLHGWLCNRLRTSTLYHEFSGRLWLAMQT